MQRRFLQLVIVCITLSLNGMDTPIGFDAFGNPVYLTQDQNGLVYPAAYYPVEVPVYVQPIYYGILASGGEPSELAGAQSAAAALQCQSDDVSQITDSLRGMTLRDDDTNTPISEQNSDSISSDRLGRRASARRMRSRSVGPCMEPHTLLRLREGIVEKKQSASISDNDEDDTAETPAACSQVSDVDSEHTVPDIGDNQDDGAAATTVFAVSCVNSRQTAFEAPASQPSAAYKQLPLTMDEKLSAALQDLSSFDSLQALTHSKVSWIASRKNTRWRQEEWDTLLS